MIIRRTPATISKGLGDLAQPQACRSEQCCLVHGLQVRLHSAEPRGVLANKSGIDHPGNLPLAFEQPAVPQMEQRLVAAKLDRQVNVGDRGAAPDHSADLLRVLYRSSPASGSGLIAMIFAPDRLAASSVVSIRG